MRRVPALLIVLFATVLLAGPAKATEIRVNTTADQAGGAPASDCSLRNAVIAADLNQAEAGCPAGERTDTILLPAGTYRLTLGDPGDQDPASGDLDMSHFGRTVIIPDQLDSKVRIDGNGLDRVFDLAFPRYGRLELKRLTISGGDTGSVEDGEFSGGAIRQSGGKGYAMGSTIAGNRTGGSGGAVFVRGDGRFAIINSTIGFNRAADSGGGMAVAGTYAALSIYNSTIARNVADSDGNRSGSGGGIFMARGAGVLIYDSILAMNRDVHRDGSAIEDCFREAKTMLTVNYLVTSQRQSTTCPFPWYSPSYPTNSLGVNPHFRGFGFHGGPTRTFAIGMNSPAIGASAIYWPDRCEVRDQRGVSRSPDICDAGAFQFSEPGKARLSSSRAPDLETAIWSGNHVWVRVRCPAGFKPECHSLSTVVIYPAVAQLALTLPRKVVIPSGKSRVIRFRIRDGYRSRIEGMTHVDRKRLYLRQAVYANQLGKSGKPGWDLRFDWYKVRVRN